MNPLKVLNIKIFIFLAIIYHPLSSFAVSDKLCSCIQYVAFTNDPDSSCQNMIADSLMARIFSRVGYTDIDYEMLLKMQEEEANILINSCEDKGYSFKAALNEYQDRDTNYGPYIKIFGIIILTILASIIRAFFTKKNIRFGDRLDILIRKAKKASTDGVEEMIIDKFELSTYDGFWQNFTKGGDQYLVEFCIFNTNLTINAFHKSAKLYYKDINSIHFSTNSRGRYNAIIDTYLELDFDYKKVVFSTSEASLSEEEQATLIKQLKKIRINKSNAKLTGKLTGVEFKSILENTLIQLTNGLEQE